MNLYQRAGEAFRKEATRLKGLQEAAAVLDEIGNLEQTAAEAESRVAAARSAEAAALANLEKAKAEACEVGKRSVAEAAEMLDAAKRASEQEIAGANAEANRIVAAAEKRATARLDDAANAAGQLEQQNADALNRLAAIGDEIAEKQTTLDAINAQLASLRERL